MWQLSNIADGGIGTTVSASNSALGVGCGRNVSNDDSREALMARLVFEEKPEFSMKLLAKILVKINNLNWFEPLAPSIDRSH
mmetsp:Transcript_5553/g.12077  ORF Transcript_5553/g.12077 Transcript_5553/m.12077 type:complete len:82 (+) Transcript_5553:643-888(+)